MVKWYGKSINYKVKHDKAANPPVILTLVNDNVLKS